MEQSSEQPEKVRSNTHASDSPRKGGQSPAYQTTADKQAAIAKAKLEAGTKERENREYILQQVKKEQQQALDVVKDKKYPNAVAKALRAHTSAQQDQSGQPEKPQSKPTADKYPNAAAKKPGELTPEERDKLPLTDLRRLYPLKPTGGGQYLPSNLEDRFRKQISEIREQQGHQPSKQEKEGHPEKPKAPEKTMSERPPNAVAKALRAHTSTQRDQLAQPEKPQSKPTAENQTPNAVAKALRAHTSPEGEKQVQKGNSQGQSEHHNVIAANALDRAAQGQGNNDLTALRHELALSTKEIEERKRVDTPKDGVGFQSGSSKLVPGTMERWKDSQPENKRAALSDSHAQVVITSMTSRLGNDIDNLLLSKIRADAVKQGLKDLGVQADIKTIALGEEPAKKAGKPDGNDDASDRVVRIEVIPALQASSPRTDDDQHFELPLTIGPPPSGKFDWAKYKEEMGKKLTQVARERGELPSFIESDYHGYSYRFDHVIGLETHSNDMLPDHVAALWALENNPSHFFPFNVEGHGGEKTLIEGHDYDLENKFGRIFPLPPGRHPVRVTEITENSFTFTTLDGHFDTPGSTVTFTIYKDTNGSIHLEHDAKTQTSKEPSIYNSFGPYGAKSAWDEQAANLSKWLKTIDQQRPIQVP